MILRVEFQAGVERDTRGIPARELQKVIATIRRYAETGYGDVKRMQGTAAVYRLRAGDYRVILEIVVDRLIVKRVAHRREVYRD